jgi:hypothetical protein
MWARARSGGLSLAATTVIRAPAPALQLPLWQASSASSSSSDWLRRWRCGSVRRFHSQCGGGCLRASATERKDSASASAAIASGGLGTRLVTTPIFYVNGPPHIGHLFTGLMADAAARWQRLNGRSVWLVTGTDEHGLKVQDAAKRAGLSNQQFCDSIAAQFKALFQRSHIGYGDGRSIDAAHHTVRCL